MPDERYRFMDELHFTEPDVGINKDLIWSFYLRDKVIMGTVQHFIMNTQAIPIIIEVKAMLPMVPGSIIEIPWMAIQYIIFEGKRSDA